MPINASVISSFEEPEKPERPEQPEKLLYQKKSSHILLNLTALPSRGRGLKILPLPITVILTGRICANRSRRNK